MTHNSTKGLPLETAADRFFRRIGFHVQGKWLVYGVLVGLISGAGSWLFLTGLIWGKYLILGKLAGFNYTEPHGEIIFELVINTPFRRWLFFILPSIGGLISGLIIYFWAPEAEGHGTDALVEAFHYKQGNIRTRIPYLKSLASLATLVTGGVAGREGPIAQIGGGIGSWAARKLGMNAHERRTMLLMGTGGGLGAIFRAPLGGAVTALEVLYREDIESSALLPTLISSFTAYVLFSSIFGFGRVFEMPLFDFTDTKELPLYILLGLLIVPIGYLYIKTFYGIRNYFRGLKMPKYLKPVVGGLLVGVVGLAYPGVYSGGYGILQNAVIGKLPPHFVDAFCLFVGLMFSMILATSFTIGSGGSGGIFGPTLFVGGMLGGAVGLVGQYFWPEIFKEPGAFVVVGMAAFFAGVAKAPIGAILMITEMTGGYGLLAPLILVCALAITLMRPWSLYEKQVHSRKESPAHVGDYTVNILRELKVREFFVPQDNIVLVPEDMVFQDIRKLMASTKVDVFPVVDKDGTLIGLLPFRAVRGGLMSEDLNGLVLAGDICSRTVAVDLDENLYDVLLKFVDVNSGELPVMDSVDKKKILGFFTYENLISAYGKEMTKRKGEN